MADIHSPAWCDAVRGTINSKVADMPEVPDGGFSFLMRPAEHVQVLLDACTSGVETDWPQGRPPYGS